MTYYRSFNKMMSSIDCLGICFPPRPKRSLFPAVPKWAKPVGACYRILSLWNSSRIGPTALWDLPKAKRWFRRSKEVSIMPISKTRIRFRRRMRPTQEEVLSPGNRASATNPKARYSLLRRKSVRRNCSSSWSSRMRSFGSENCASPETTRTTLRANPIMTYSKRMCPTRCAAEPNSPMTTRKGPKIKNSSKSSKNSAKSHSTWLAWKRRMRSSVTPKKNRKGLTNLQLLRAYWMPNSVK